MKPPAMMWWCILAFAVSCLLMHIPVFRKKKNKPFWIKTDYFWLAIGMLGVLGTASGVEREYARIYSKIQSEFFPVSRNDIISIVRWHVRHYERLLDDDRNEDRKKNQAEYVRVSDWMKAADQAVSSTEQSALKAFILEKGKEISSAEPHRADQNEVLGYLKELDENWTLALELKAAESRGLIETLSFVFGPIALSIAVGLRTAKVTAQLYELC